METAEDLFLCKITYVNIDQNKFCTLSKVSYFEAGDQVAY